MDRSPLSIATPQPVSYSLDPIVRSTADVPKLPDRHLKASPQKRGVRRGVQCRGDSSEPQRPVGPSER